MNADRVLRLPILTTALLLGALLLPERASAQDQAVQNQQAQNKVTEARNTMADEWALRYQLVELKREAAALRDEYERARDVVTQLEARLRDMRLAGEEGEEYERFKAELSAAQTEARDMAARLNVAEDEAAQAEASLTMMHERSLIQQQEQERRAQQEQLQQTAVQQQQALARAEQTLAEARQFAAGDNPAAALREALAQTQIQKLQGQYAAFAQQAERARLLAERGMSSPQELIELQSRADMALSELREAELRRLLDQVEHEQDAFAQRQGEKQPAEGAERENALQTAFFRGYVDTVQQYARLSSDPDSAAVAAALTAADLLRPQGPQAVIAYFEPILADLEARGGGVNTRDSSAVEAAVRLQLAEAYHSAGQPEESLRVLRGVILSGRQTTRPAREPE